MSIVTDIPSIIKHWFRMAGISLNPSLCTDIAYIANQGPELESGSYEHLLERLSLAKEIMKIVLSPRQQQRLGAKGHKFSDFIREELSLCAGLGVSIVGAESDLYPIQLRVINAAPLALYVMGNSKFCGRSIAIVGSRKAAKQSLELSYRLAKLAVINGWTVVSGGALGCDIAAHEGALATAKPKSTICIQAGGLLHLYPRYNDATFSKMRKSGAQFISERPVRYKPQPYDFPIRNRIIAGMAAATVLVQAAARSGASITATLAADFGRDLFVYRGPHDHRYSRNHQFIAEGATSFQNLRDLSSIWRDPCLLRCGLDD